MARTRQIDPHSRWLPARYAAHIVSFVLQDMLFLFLIGSMDSLESSTIDAGWGESGANTLMATIGIGAIITSLSLFIVWLCQDEESYWTLPSSFAWLYVRAALAVFVTILGFVLHYGTLAPIGIAVLTIALVGLVIATLIDATILSIRGILAG